MPDIRLQPNNPATLSLSDPSGVPEDWTVHYALEDGRTLTLPWKTAVALNELDLRPGESFCICRDVQEVRGIPQSHFRVWLSPETEKRRAAEETASVNAIANGLGSQSMYLVVLAAEGRIPCRYSITADTGAEDDCLWSTGERSTAREYFDRVVKPYCVDHGIDARFVRARNKYGKEITDLVTHVRTITAAGKAPAVPLFGSKGGRLMQGCTQKWKIVAIHQEARRLGAKRLRTAQGIHFGEAARRMKGRFLRDEEGWSIYQEVIKFKGGYKDVKWCTHFYPLVDLRLKREDVRKILTAKGIPFLESSECDHCPHKDLPRWQRTAPDKLVIFDPLAVIAYEQVTEEHEG